MLKRLALTVLSASVFACLGEPAQSQAQYPEAIAAKVETKIAEFHAEGAQIYECKPDAEGKLAWRFREPVASLMSEGKTVGRHYAGPTWELTDGSVVVGKVLGQAPGATAKDIPWLKLTVADSRGKGQLSGATIVQRVNTSGGVAAGACTRQGDFQAVPYSSDYVFLK